MLGILWPECPLHERLRAYTAWNVPNEFVRASDHSGHSAPRRSMKRGPTIDVCHTPANVVMLVSGPGLVRDVGGTSGRQTF